MVRNMLHKVMFTGFTVRAAVLLSPEAAHAQATLTAGNTPQDRDENVLLNSGETGFAVNGLTQSGRTVDFSVTTSLLEGPLTATANGQARVDAVDGRLNNVGISVPNGSFTSCRNHPRSRWQRPACSRWG